MLAFILLFPLVGALLLMIFRHMPRALAGVIGVGSVTLAAVMVAVVDVCWLFHSQGAGWSQTLWTWMADTMPLIGGKGASFFIPFVLRLDGLSLTMVSVITGVGALIHLFAAWYMLEDRKANPGYLFTRFFACMNLFVFAMLLLVLGGNMLVMFFGWEGVGVCSYLLIGYYHRDAMKTWAAFKAFIMTRLGDIFLAVAMFMIFCALGTLDMGEIPLRAAEVWHKHDVMVEVIALLILGGAVGKSAQLPLQTWLADAMAGPTPVSALIHAATMVTAGVYLIARLHGLYLLAPFALNMVGVVGAVTLVMAGFIALAQRDIKRILAYSTMSQLGYMFVALGCGAWRAALFHLMTHAFFKALLFLASGSVIVACHHEQDITQMGGLAKRLRLPWASFMIGGASLAALPVVTAGFYSKDAILWQSFASGHYGLWAAGLVGAFLTGLYTARLIILVFYGRPAHSSHPVEVPSGWMHHFPLVCLCILATGIGALIHPPVEKVLPAVILQSWPEAVELLHMVVASCVGLAGIGVALLLFSGERRLIKAVVRTRPGRAVWTFLSHACGFDALYDRLFVRSFLFITLPHCPQWFKDWLAKWRGGALAWPHRGHRADWIDLAMDFLPAVTRLGSRTLSRTQNGLLRHYAVFFLAGAACILLILTLG